MDLVVILLLTNFQPLLGTHVEWPPYVVVWVCTFKRPTESWIMCVQEERCLGKGRQWTSQNSWQRWHSSEAVIQVHVKGCISHLWVVHAAGCMYSLAQSYGGLFYYCLLICCAQFFNGMNWTDQSIEVGFPSNFVVSCPSCNVQNQGCFTKTLSWLGMQT